MSGTSLARVALAFLVALVIPVHATAGAIAGLCSALGHHEALAVGERAPDAGSSASHGGHYTQADGQDGSQCAPCGTCCGVATISGALELSVGLSVSFQPVNEPVSHIAGLPPARLDRPPLSF